MENSSRNSSFCCSDRLRFFPPSAPSGWALALVDGRADECLSRFDAPLGTTASADAAPADEVEARPLPSSRARFSRLAGRLSTPSWTNSTLIRAPSR